MGFRFIALVDDNFYPVTPEGLAVAARRKDSHRLRELEGIRAERFDLMDQLSRLPDDLVFYTQITMEAAEDPEFLKAMRRPSRSRSVPRWRSPSSSCSRLCRERSTSTGGSKSRGTMGRR